METGSPNIDPTYVLQIENFDGKIVSKPMSKSNVKQFIYKFALTISTHEYLGRDYSPEDGNLFYDPLISAREPTREYLRWMMDDEIAELNPENDKTGATCIAGILHLCDNTVLRNGHRKIKKRYAIYLVKPTIWDMMATETEGDKRLQTLQAAPLCLTDDSLASIRGDLDEPSDGMDKYLPASYTIGTSTSTSSTLNITDAPSATNQV